jgi:leader peptidase (prepilin peptidase)/N-methyltransferase
LAVVAGGVGVALDPLWRRLAAGIPAGRWLGAPVDPPAVLGLAVGVLAAALALTAGPVVIPLAPVAVVATAIDVRWHRLPDRLTIGATVLLGSSVLVAAVATGEVALAVRAAGGAALLAGLLLLVHVVSPSGMGFGDVKLGVPLGLALGAASLADVVVAVVVASVLGTVAGLVVLVRHRDRARAFAFGPCLCLGAVLVLLAA